MRNSKIVAQVITVCLLLVATRLSWSADNKQPWQQLYTGAEATGASVISLWQFLPGQESKDNSGHGHDLKLRGEARFVTEGPFGGALESFPADTKNDKAQGAIARSKPDLSP
ncbi:MAG: hypothetical protein COS85_24505, partial [Armatimonadetes bacterium CG07_land_8_20_14_0_80_59_28]